MFDTVSGLPVHILVVHAAVVLIPMMALVTLAFTLRPRWRPGLSWAVLGNLAGLGAAFVAKESGEKLQARLSSQAGQLVAGDHGDLGAKLPYFALAALVGSVIAWFLVGRATSADGTRSASVTAVATSVVLVLALGGAATFWTVRVGDSGSRAAWEDTIANTKAP